MQVKPIGVNWGYHATQELEAAGAAAIKSFHDLANTNLMGVDNVSLNHLEGR